MKPTFIGIGAQKCASSWLYYILQDHPEVCLSEKKELDFFSFHYDNGYQWYESHFNTSRPVKAVGEISPSYFHDYRAPSRAALFDPDLKVILSLREPVERAFSHHKHLVKLGFFNGPDFSFEAGMKLNPMYVEQGLYATHLAHWLESFDQQQVLVIFMDDIKKDASAVVKEVYGFLGIDKGHTPAALHDKSNPSYVVRNRALDIIVKEGRAIAERLGLGALWALLGKTPVRSLYRAANRIDSESVIPPMLPETREALQAHFDPELQRLFKMIGREFPWRVFANRESTPDERLSGKGSKAASG